ncbi:MAG: OmpW family outer membrane protein [Pseudomonadota bacterium]
MTRTRLTTTAALSAIALASTVMAAQPAMAGDTKWRLRIGPASINHSESASIDVGGAPLAGGSVNITNNRTLAAEIGYRFTPEWSVGFTFGAPPTATIHGAGTAAALGEIGEVKYGPAALTLQYQFNTDGALKPYVGAGATYLIALDTSDGAVSGLKVDNSWGGVLQAGFEYKISDRMDFFFDVKKLFVDTTATGTVPAFGGAAAEADITLDSLIFHIGTTFHF